MNKQLKYQKPVFGIVDFELDVIQASGECPPVCYSFGPHQNNGQLNDDMPDILGK